MLWKHQIAFADNFTGKDIRLVGGNSELEGRVEISINGIWGTICGDGLFDFTDADVLCRMLHTNLSALDYYTDGRNGYGNGPVFYRSLSCTGLEKTIHNCSSSTGESCSHSNDVGVICAGCSRLTQRHYGLLEHVNITSNGDVYTGRCSNGTSYFQFLYQCALNGTWEEYGTRCGPLALRDVRFVGGVGLYDGTVEVRVGDTWGPVCGYKPTVLLLPRQCVL
ncbi:scavenger receptor cysteine-rich domain superfamily protein-like [Dreissena polymorpha]|uniref:scavenger receptor cysteine-rich domain superfamily protein-like n=1 Tax=Dreissena polymorpha TaxID=45954 RepID=UPI002263BB87|nr:scavenger receptor cysteine-rich domain superfamily protein-like [Dreissena polymorpha]